MTFEEYKAAIAKTPLSEAERKKVQDFRDAVREINRSLIRAGQDEVGSALGQYAGSAAFVVTDPAEMGSEESHKAWEKDAEKLDGLHDFLLQGDNFKHIMQAGAGGENPPFGVAGELFFDVLEILHKIGMDIDASEWRKHYDDMQKGLEWKKDAKPHKAEEPEEEVKAPEEEIKAPEGPKNEEQPVKEEAGQEQEAEKKVENVADKEAEKQNAPTQNVPGGENLTLEERSRRLRRDAYIKDVNDTVRDAESGYQRFFDIYGPNGKMLAGLDDEQKKIYDSITLEVPEGLDEMTVTAIVLGAAMQRKYMDQNLSSSSIGGGTLISSNQMHLVNNLMMESIDLRDVGYAPILVAARKEAQAAIKAFTEQDPSKVKEYLQNYLDFCAANVASVSASTGSNAGIDTEKLAYAMGQELVETNPFGLKPSPDRHNEISNLRLASYGKEMEAMKTADTLKQNLIHHFDELDPEVKQEMIADMLFNNYLSCEAKQQERRRGQQKDAYVKELFRNYGVNTESDSYVMNFANNKAIIDLGNKLTEGLQRYTISDFDVVLAGPEGKEQLYRLYKDAIVKSPVYKKLMDADSKDAFVDGLKETDLVVYDGLTSLPGVKLPQVAEPYNQKQQAKNEFYIKQMQEQIVSAAYQQEKIWKNETDEYTLKSLKAEDVQANAQKMDELYKQLAAEDSWRSPRSFKAVLTAMEKVRDIAWENAAKSSNGSELNTLSEKEAVAYKRSLKELDDAIEAYQKDIAGTGEVGRSREIATTFVRRRAKASGIMIDDAVDEMKREMTKTLYDEQLKIYNDLNPVRRPYRNVFEGEKYADQNTRTGSSYSLSRSAGISVTIFALFNTGKYSFEDIMDPEKLQAEKLAMYDEVAQRMLNNTPENQEWIARTIYEGQKNTDLAINEQAKLIDFATVDHTKDKRFCQIMHLANCQYDAWQELSHCQEEIGRIVHAERPEIKGYKDYSIWWRNRMGLLKSLVDAIPKMQGKAIGAATNYGDAGTAFGEFLTEQMKQRMYMDVLREAKEKDPDKPIEEILGIEKMRELESKLVQLTQALSKVTKAYDGKPLAAKQDLASLIDGSYLDSKGIKFDPETHQVTLTGFPDEETLAEREAILRAEQKPLQITFSEVMDQAREATAGVWLGSKEYDRAMESLESVQRAYAELREMEAEEEQLRLAGGGQEASPGYEESHRDKVEELRGLISAANRNIDAYFARKERQGKMEPDADEKSMKRISVMQDAQQAIRDCEVLLDEEERVEKYLNDKNRSAQDKLTGELEQAMQDAKDIVKEHGDKLTGELEQAAQDAKDIVKENGEKLAGEPEAGADRRAALQEQAASAERIDSLGANGALKGLEVLEELAKGEGPLTVREKRMVRLAMASLAFVEMLQGPEGAVIREKIPQNIDTYKAQVKKLADSEDFKKAMPQDMDRAKLREFLADEKAPAKLTEDFRKQMQPQTRKRSNTIVNRGEELKKPADDMKKTREELKKTKENKQAMEQRKRSHTVAKRN